MHSALFTFGANGLEQLTAPDLAPGTVLESDDRQYQFVVIGPDRHGTRSIRTDAEHERTIHAQDIGDACLSPISRLHIIEGKTWDDDERRALVRRYEEHVAERRASLKRAEDERTRHTDAGRAYLRQHAPADARGVIVAEYEERGNDGYNDWKRITRRVVLAYSTHTRDLFSEMRKAADTFPETAHLGTGKDRHTPELRADIERSVYVNGTAIHPGERSRHYGDQAPTFETEDEARAWIEEQPAPLPQVMDAADPDAPTVYWKWKIRTQSVEHREKYSMGSGYYLAVPFAPGWQVRKYSAHKTTTGHPSDWIDGRICQDIGAALDAGDVSQAYRPTTGSTAPQEASLSPEQAEGVTVEEYSERALVVRGDTKPIKDELKAIGGRFNAKLKGGPGWIFSKKKADQLDALLSGETVKAAAPQSKTADADKLRSHAEALHAKAEKRRPSRDANPTPKRLREWASGDHAADDMQRAAEALAALADAHDAGTCPVILQDIKTQKEALKLTATKVDTSGGYYSLVATGEPRDTSPKAEALRALVTASQSDEDREAQAEAEKAREVQRMVGELAGSKIPGFFPTPPQVAARLIDRLPLAPGCRVLEPSAGTGNLADAVKAAEPQAVVEVIEQSATLCTILRAKGYNAPRPEDFLTWAQRGGEFDAVVMNPPFEKRQDAEHIRAAYDLLKPGGTLAAVCGAGVFFGSDKKAQAFREWLDEVAADVEDLPEGSFQGTGEIVQTGVAAKLVFIDKPSDEDEDTAPQNETWVPVGDQSDGPQGFTATDDQLEAIYAAAEASTLPDHVSAAELAKIDRKIERAKKAIQKWEPVAYAPMQTPGPFVTGRSNYKLGRRLDAENERKSKAFRKVKKAQDALKWLKTRRAAYLAGEVHPNGQPRKDAPSRTRAAEAAVTYAEAFRQLVKPGDKVFFSPNPQAGPVTVRRLNKKTVTTEPHGTTWDYLDFLPLDENGEPLTISAVMQAAKPAEPQEPFTIDGPTCEPHKGFVDGVTFPEGYPRLLLLNENNPRDILRAVAYGPEDASVEAKNKDGEWYSMKSKSGPDAHERAVQDAEGWYPEPVKIQDDEAEEEEAGSVCTCPKCGAELQLTLF